MSSIQDCYWYIDGRLPEDKQIIEAMCVGCHKTHDFGWFWAGSVRGYGDYDLRCSLCGHDIYLRELDDKNEKTQTSS